MHTEGWLIPVSDSWHVKPVPVQGEKKKVKHMEIIFLCGINNSMYPCLYLLFHTMKKQKRNGIN